MLFCALNAVKGMVINMKIRNMLISAILLCAVIIGASVSEAFAYGMDGVNTKNGKIDVNVNGEYLSFDTDPIMRNERVLVPMRAIFEKLGASVEWDDTAKKAIAVKDGDEVTIAIGENKITKNGSEIWIDVPAEIVNNRTLVPIRAVSEAFGAWVGWFGHGEDVVTISTFAVTGDDAINAVIKIKGSNPYSIEICGIYKAKYTMGKIKKGTTIYNVVLNYNWFYVSGIGDVYDAVGKGYANDIDYDLEKPWGVSVTDGTAAQLAG